MPLLPAGPGGRAGSSALTGLRRPAAGVALPGSRPLRPAPVPRLLGLPSPSRSRPSPSWAFLSQPLPARSQVGRASRELEVWAAGNAGRGEALSREGQMGRGGHSHGPEWSAQGQ